MQLHNSHGFHLDTHWENCLGSMKPPDLAYYRQVKALFAELYVKYHLEPAECCGLNVCMECDIWNYATGN